MSINYQPVSTFTVILLFIVFVRYFLFVFTDGLPATYEAAPFKKGIPPKHIVNGKSVQDGLLIYYHTVLDLPYQTRLTEELVVDGYQRNLRYLEESIRLNEKPRYTREEIEAARKYLQDFINYMAYVN
jgi:hypothetical protein